MRLNYKTKEELRKQIEAELIIVEDGKKIKLDKDLLEDLLFEECTLGKIGRKVKIPVWSGEFLRKIDLSEIDFTDVSWSCYMNGEFNNGFCYVDSEETKKTFYIDSDVDDRISDMINKKIADEKYAIDYSYTNANIDLTKSYEFKSQQLISIDYCNFRGLDFSKQDIKDCYLSIDFSDVSNTGLKLNDAGTIYLSYSSLEGLDLSSYEILGFEYFEGGSDSFVGCNLANTGIKISLNSIDFTVEKLKQELKGALNKSFVGCYVNGKLIKSSTEKKKTAQEKLEEYTKIKNELMDSILYAIQEQTSYEKKYKQKN